MWAAFTPAGGPWARLPNVTPAQIGAAKCIRKLLTGDLQAEVVSYPPFPGNEAVYLRAQIARIAAATEVAPANYYNIVEQGWCSCFSLWLAS